MSWGQVRAGLDPKAYSLHTYGPLLNKADPWKGFRAAEVTLRSILKRVL